MHYLRDTKPNMRRQKKSFFQTLFLHCVCSLLGIDSIYVDGTLGGDMCFILCGPYEVPKSIQTQIMGGCPHRLVSLDRPSSIPRDRILAQQVDDDHSPRRTRQVGPQGVGGDSKSAQPQQLSHLILHATVQYNPLVFRILRTALRIRTTLIPGRLQEPGS